MATCKAPGPDRIRRSFDASTSSLSAPLLPTVSLSSPGCCLPPTDGSSCSTRTLGNAISTPTVRAQACKPVSLLASCATAPGATHITSCQQAQTSDASQTHCRTQRRVKTPWHKVPQPLGGTAGVLSDIDHVRWYTWTRLPYTKDGSRVYLFRCQAKRAPRKDAARAFSAPNLDFLHGRLDADAFREIITTLPGDVAEGRPGLGGLCWLVPVVGCLYMGAKSDARAAANARTVEVLQCRFRELGVRITRRCRRDEYECCMSWYDIELTSDV